LGSRPELFAIVGGLWTHYVVAGKFDIALGIGEELLRMAEAANSPAMVVAAGNCLGITLHHLGDHRRALEYFERASEALDVRFRTAFLGFPWDPGVNLVAQSSRVLWVLGYPDRALARIRDAIFHGSAERMFAQFVSDRKLGREELERMRRLLAERLKEEP